MHPHTQALNELLTATAFAVPPHSGACIDFHQKHWPVTEASCKCSDREKRLRKAISAARATLDYDAPPSANG